MKIQAEVSVYPLKTVDPTPIICEFIAHVREANVTVEPGSMSTRVRGEYDDVTAAITTAYKKSIEKQTAVLCVTYNPCAIID